MLGITRQGCVKSRQKYRHSIQHGRSRKPIIHSISNFKCKYNYFRTELFVGSRILPGFTICKEKISNLDFSGLYLYRTDSELAKAPILKNYQSFDTSHVQIGCVYEAVEARKKTDGRTDMSS